MNLKQILNEENKTPAQIEHEHQSTYDKVRDMVIDKLNRIKKAGAIDNMDIEGTLKAHFKNYEDEFFNGVVNNHQSEFPNYYIWLKWMEEQMKKYNTPGDLLDDAMTPLRAKDDEPVKPE